MIDKIKKTLREASDIIKDQASNISEGAKERSYKLIEEWLEVFPKLEIYGLEITSFAMGVGLNPSLEVELKGNHKDFGPERLEKILEENKTNTTVSSVFKTIKTTYKLHRRIYATLSDPLIVQVKIRLSPEIKVFIGQPLIT
ncbi:MAG: hypothetical protein MRY78_19150 [Saprospiraceae bacterium]|nr:hypothetical protein [Saprospiraceae bacterium]